ncbi:rRNA (guanine-N1)-methyltransferase [Thalassotalea sp. LPB0316]|uniref:pilus assembly protein n=1 Tax=Thalassotalea sp. LPB0316 TaxID=2769490 RepID=UPI00186689F3|nr:PilC/PilY family type IV pilus protein [Thalassotalea sp. LPB0316]QOL25772.1 rRNA (guanine-N1)-methyltransferase [Thalassotalea sp. LPB0316]
MKKFIVSTLLALVSTSLIAEDIELYVGNTAQRTGNKPQVLIIFDNSGSMSTDETVKPLYDPNTVYPAVGGLNSLSENFIYFTKGSGVDNASMPVPDSPSESRRFLDAINSCEEARVRLETVGFYTGYIREYAFSGNSGSWQEIPDNNGANIEVIDCWDDIREENPKNAGIEKKNGSIEALPDGYPVDGLGSKGNPVYYTNDVNASNTAFGTGEVVTLYSDNYLRYYQNSSLTNVSISRMDIAKAVMTDLIESAPSVDFGLQVFNFNAYDEYEHDGGRVVFGIQDMTDSATAELIDIIDNGILPQTNTPLCESLYEAMRYFGGQAVLYGKESRTSGTPKDEPDRDYSIETGSGNSKTYTSPYKGCSNEVYVIMMTDGKPTKDNAADGLIGALPGVGSKFSGNYLPALAGWMKNNDINNAIEGVQTATTYTIGFSSGADDAAPILKEAAKLGGGQYYPAQDAAGLLAALQSALVEILRVNASFTSPSIASNNFDRTETLDSVYYAMFLPDRGPRWQGNIKKLKLTDGKQVDREGNVAIDENGNIKSTAKTFWSTSPVADGEDVTSGGVAEMLRSQTVRKLYSDIGSNNALVSFNKTNVSNAYGGDEELATYMNVPEEELESYLNWFIGFDEDDSDRDNSTTDIREDVFADPLHSKPLVVNYGGSASSQDVRIIVGTNAGVLHMFDDNGDTVEESWAIMFKEFFPNIAPLRANYTSSDKIYGIDGSATVHLQDLNGDGSIDEASGDKAWLYFGLRRGGSSYYGIDISDPDTPKMLWKIDETTEGFERLAQSWSKPKVTYAKNNIVNGVPKPVVIFGGGYSTAKDVAGVGQHDTVGNAIFMVDAQTGVLKWSLTPDATSSTNTKFTDLTDSIPSSIAILDSDSDGLTDRLYVGDTGANVFRVDMPSASPFDSESPWTAFKIAALGGEQANSSNDRRFFNEPSIVRALITNTISTTKTNELGDDYIEVTRQDTPYDALLIGSGDRSAPSSIDTSDMFFMIKDKNIITRSFVGENPAPAPIQLADLYDYTNDPFGQSLSATAQTELEIAVSAKDGWYIDFAAEGEKSMSSATALAGVAYFNTFTPAESVSGGQCTLNTGSGKLYAVDLAQGTSIYNWLNTDGTGRDYLDVGDRVPDTPTVVIPPPEEGVTGSGKIMFVGVGAGSDGKGGSGSGTLTLCEASNCDVLNGFTLETMRTHLYIEEDNK